MAAMGFWLSVSTEMEEAMVTTASWRRPPRTLRRSGCRLRYAIMSCSGCVVGEIFAAVRGVISHRLRAGKLCDHCLETCR